MAKASMIAAAIVLSCAGASRADEIADFYRGKTINMIVSSAAGGGHDITARAVARHLPRHIPGNPQIVVRNLPGAGGLVAANNLYNMAPRDGLTIAQFSNTLPFEPVFGNKEANFDPSRFAWLGTHAMEHAILIVWRDTPVASVDDIRKREITVGTSGVLSSSSYNTRLLATALDMKLRIVTGYPGQAEVLLAMERREVDAFPSYYSSTMSAKPEWVADGTIKIIVQFGPEPEPTMKNVPFAGDLVTDPAKARLLRLGTAPQALGRPFVAPPGLPAERLAALRKAFADTFADPEYNAEAKKLALTINTPKSGEELQRIMEDVSRMPASTRDELRKLSGAQ